MTIIDYGNIEVLVGSDNVGVPINATYPFNLSSGLPQQIKSRTGVTTGNKLDDLTDDNGNVIESCKGRWSGTTKTGASCEVRIWETGR